MKSPAAECFERITSSLGERANFSIAMIQTPSPRDARLSLCIVATQLR
jgi:hypothetical protein